MTAAGMGTTGKACLASMGNAARIMGSDDAKRSPMPQCAKGRSLFVAHPRDRRGKRNKEEL